MLTEPCGWSEDVNAWEDCPGGAGDGRGGPDTVVLLPVRLRRGVGCCQAQDVDDVHVVVGEPLPVRLGDDTPRLDDLHVRGQGDMVDREQLVEEMRQRPGRHDQLQASEHVLQVAAPGRAAGVLSALKSEVPVATPPQNPASPAERHGRTELRKRIPPISAATVAACGYAAGVIGRREATAAQWRYSAMREHVGCSV